MQSKHSIFVYIRTVFVYARCMCRFDGRIIVLFVSVHFIVQVCFLLRSYKRSLSMSFEENKGRRHSVYIM